MKNIDSFGHLRGESLFVDDIITRQNTLFGLVFDSPKAHGNIISVNCTTQAIMTIKLIVRKYSSSKGMSKY